MTLILIIIKCFMLIVIFMRNLRIIIIKQSVKKKILKIII